MGKLDLKVVEGGAERSPFIEGFDAGINWLLDPRPDPLDPREYYKPPKGLEGCESCAKDGYDNESCPRCQYTYGFAEGART